LKNIPIRGPVPPPVAERPKCAYCNTPLKPSFTRVWDNAPGGGMQAIAKVWDHNLNGGYNSYFGLFDTKGCALQFARAAHAAGFRRGGAK
jgi:hypothetical protein